MMERIVALIDMDCFYVQVEQRAKPQLRGKPCAVVQYNQYRGGGIIAVSYEARDQGVKRQMRGKDAKAVCPNIQLISVPCQREKADLTKYREAGAEVITVLCQFSDKVERASVDEAFIDLTDFVERRLSASDGDLSVHPDMLPCTHVVGWKGKENSGKEKTEKDTPNSQEKVGSSKEAVRRYGVECWLKQIEDNNDRRLAVAALVVEEMRAAILEQTEFNCSAGIAHNKAQARRNSSELRAFIRENLGKLQGLKMLAKLACGLNKPRKQTILPHSSVPDLFSDLSISKVRKLGGKLGLSLVNDLNVATMGDLCRFSEVQLQAKLGDKTGLFMFFLLCGVIFESLQGPQSHLPGRLSNALSPENFIAWLYRCCRGFEDEPVRPRQLPKSVGCSKNFTGKSCLDTRDKVKFWLGQLAEEVEERLKKEETMNNRVAKSLHIYVRQDGRPPISSSRQCALTSPSHESMTRAGLAIIQSLNRAGNHQAAWSPAVISLGVSASKFTESPMAASENGCLDSFFSKNANSQVDEKVQGNSGTQQNHVAGKRKTRESLDRFFTKKNRLSNRDGAEQQTDDETETELPNFELLKSENGYAFDDQVSRNVDEISSEVCVDVIVSPKPKRRNLDRYFSPRSGDHVVESSIVTSQRKTSETTVMIKDCEKNEPSNSCKPHETFFQPSTSKDSSSGLRGFFEVKETVASKANSPFISSSDLIAESSNLESAVLSDPSKTLPVQGDIESNTHDKTSHKDSTDFIQCEQCAQMISVWVYPEHLDFHVAMNIHEQVNKPVSSGKGRAMSASSKKAKVVSQSSNSTLDSFFWKR